MLDPFWNTTTKPHDQPLGEPPGSGDNWDWTLGHAQYSWLAQTLALSNISFKFVFIHHLTAGLNTYGRGGIEAVRHELGGCGSFEWGGEDLDGRYVFPRKRPGWPVPVHNLLVDHDATIVFHGHDHLFVHQELDGIVYQECPMPSDPSYGYGHISHLYTHGEQRPNSGHLRVTVWPTRVRVDYVRAFLPGDGDNGSVEYSYEVLIR